MCSDETQFTQSESLQENNKQLVKNGDYCFYFLLLIDANGGIGRA